MIVVDASVMVMALSSPSARGDATRAALAEDTVWIAPGHMPLEVLRTLRRAVVGGHLTEQDATAAFTAFAAAAITYVTTSVPLLRAVWGMRHNVSAYDAAYLAVAVEYGAPLVTLDHRLATTASQTAPSVEVRVL